MCAIYLFLHLMQQSNRCWPGHCTPEEEAISWRTGWKNLETLKRDPIIGNAVRAIGVSTLPCALCSVYLKWLCMIILHCIASNC